MATSPVLASAVLAGALLTLPVGAAIAANAVTTAPTNVHANRTGSSTVLNTIDAGTMLDASACGGGWCATAGGYVRSSKIRFVGTGKRARDAARQYDSYDYNVPLALPPYGYTPGFWGYGGKRYYDRYGNYRKYSQP